MRVDPYLDLENSCMRRSDVGPARCDTYLKRNAILSSISRRCADKAIADTHHQRNGEPKLQMTRSRVSQPRTETLRAMLAQAGMFGLSALRLSGSGRRSKDLRRSRTGETPLVPREDIGIR